MRPGKQLANEVRMRGLCSTHSFLNLRGRNNLSKTVV